MCSSSVQCLAFGLTPVPQGPCRGSPEPRCGWLGLSFAAGWWWLSNSPAPLLHAPHPRSQAAPTACAGSWACLDRRLATALPCSLRRSRSRHNFACSRVDHNVHTTSPRHLLCTPPPSRLHVTCPAIHCKAPASGAGLRRQQGRRDLRGKQQQTVHWGSRLAALQPRTPQAKTRALALIGCGPPPSRPIRYICPSLLRSHPTSLPQLLPPAGKSHVVRTPATGSRSRCRVNTASARRKLSARTAPAHW